MRNTMYALMAAAVVATPVAVHAQQDMRTTIAVLPFDNGSIVPEYSPLGKGFQALMLNDLATNGKIRVLERDQIQRILDEQKLGTSGMADPATLIKVGKLLQAKYMITGTFVGDKAQGLKLTTRVWNTETSEIVYAETTALFKTTKYMDMISAATKTANTKLNLPQLTPNTAPAREAAAVQEKAKKMPLETALLYSRALEAKDSGKPAEARTLFNKVLTAFPEYEPAQRELDKLPK